MILSRRPAVVFVVVFAAAQFFRPERTSPATDATRTIRAHVGTASGLVGVLDRACGDCHSNETTWPWYTKIAPVSWLMALSIAEGRKAVNFSNWGTYSVDEQRTLLSASCDDTSNGRMPGRAWTLLHPEARLAPEDIETICTAARRADTSAAGVSR
jgi:hypothetical protein